MAAKQMKSTEARRLGDELREKLKVAKANLKQVQEARAAAPFSDGKGDVDWNAKVRAAEDDVAGIASQIVEARKREIQARVGELEAEMPQRYAAMQTKANTVGQRLLEVAGLLAEIQKMEQDFRIDQKFCKAHAPELYLRPPMAAAAHEWERLVERANREQADARAEHVEGRFRGRHAPNIIPKELIEAVRGAAFSKRMIVSVDYPTGAVAEFFKLVGSISAAAAADAISDEEERAQAAKNSVMEMLKAGMKRIERIAS